MRSCAPPNVHASASAPSWRRARAALASRRVVPRHIRSCHDTPYLDGTHHDVSHIEEVGTAKHETSTPHHVMSRRINCHTLA